MTSVASLFKTSCSSRRRRYIKGRVGGSNFYTCMTNTKSPRTTIYLRFYYLVISAAEAAEENNKYLHFCHFVVQQIERANSENYPQVQGISKHAIVQNVEDGIMAKACHDIFSTPWGHHKLLIDKFLKAPEKAIFYVHKTVEPKSVFRITRLQNVSKTCQFVSLCYCPTTFLTLKKHPLKSRGLVCNFLIQLQLQR